MTFFLVCLTTGIVSMASGHTVILVQDNATIILPNATVSGATYGETGFYLTTSGGTRNYNPVGSTTYPYSRTNNTRVQYQGYKVSIFAADPAQDNVMAYYPEYPTVTFGSSLVGE